MTALTDFLSAETLQKLQDAFSAVSELPIRIYDAAGRPMTEPSAAGGGAPAAHRADRPAGPGGASEVPVLIGSEVAGRIRYCRGDGSDSRPVTPTEHGLSLLRLMANILGRLCDREREIHARVDELATLYHLTAEFSGPRDLQGVLDLVADTVVKVLRAKACAIRLLSEDHSELVVKAVANLSAEYLNKGPVLVSQSPLDQEALTAGRPVYARDWGSDPRVLYPQEARREGIVSALCAPLVYRGHPEGVLRAYMGRVHEFNWFEVSLLQAVAAQAAAAIVNARLREEAIRSHNMRRQLRLAGEVQRQMIPAQPPQPPGFDMAAIYVPCFELGGDFYDFIDLPPDNLGVAVCDVVGKGIRASLLMASIRASLRANAENVYHMSQVLDAVNRNLCADSLVSDFATMFYGVLEVPVRRFTYANAGHTPPLLARGGQCCHLTTGGGVLGLDPSLHWNHDSFILQPHDLILIYTDGLPEAMNFKDEPFGRPRVERSLLEAASQGLSADGIVKHVLWQMRRFAGLHERTDDLTLVAIKVV